MSGVASAAHTPFIAAVSASFFNIDSFETLPLPRDLAKVFELPDFIKWNSFRNSEDSRYISLVLPRVLMRLPYGPDTLPVAEFNFTEDVGVGDTDRFCWGNPAYALAQRITDAFAKYNWTAAIRGVEGGGVIEGLPTYIFKTLDGDMSVKCPTEVAITDRREKELSDLGFISACYCKGTDYAVFFGAQTTQKPKIYNLDDANANSSISARLTYLLAASRFAHYIKVLMRDKVGSFLTKENVEFYLNNWLGSYILLNDDAPATIKAQFPLREGRIDVYDVPGNPGAYKSVIYLRPHFQMEELTASIRLVASLPARAG
jgi:type VI secretion system protein ImpC